MERIFHLTTETVVMIICFDSNNSNFNYFICYWVSIIILYFVLLI